MNNLILKSFSKKRGLDIRDTKKEYKNILKNLNEKEDSLNSYVVLKNKLKLSEKDFSIIDLTSYFLELGNEDFLNFRKRFLEEEGFGTISTQFSERPENRSKVVVLGDEEEEEEETEEESLNEEGDEEEKE